MIPGSRLFIACRLNAGEWNGLWSVPATRVCFIRAWSILPPKSRGNGIWSILRRLGPLEGESVEDFLRREIEAYRPQILGYGEIWARLTGTDPAHIDAFIYWTALRENKKILLEIKILH